MVVIGSNCGHYEINFYCIVLIIAWKMNLFIKHCACTKWEHYFLYQIMELIHLTSINKM